MFFYYTRRNQQDWLAQDLERWLSGLSLAPAGHTPESVFRVKPNKGLIQ